MAVAPAAQDLSAEHTVEVHLVVVVHAEAVRSLTAEVHSHMAEVHSHTAEVLTVVVRSHMAEAVHTVEALTEDMVAWEAVDKIIVPAHVPLHSSCAVSRS